MVEPDEARNFETASRSSSQIYEKIVWLAGVSGQRQLYFWKIIDADKILMI